MSVFSKALPWGHILEVVLSFCDSDDLDVDVRVVVFTRVDVDPPGLRKGHEGAEAQQVDCSDEGKHGRPRACSLDEIPREIHHEDPCRGRQSHRQAFPFRDPVLAIKYLFP